MGIRFLCRHCSQPLNVNKRQAGSHGKCPHCEKSIQVPLASTILHAEHKANRPPNHDSDIADSDSPGSPAFDLGRPSPPESFGKIDPIADAPNRVWYYRSRSLGEKGPLKSTVMQQHLDRGDVSVGCVVWRDDWDEWVPAESAFPILGELAKSQKRKSMLERAIRESNYELPDELNHSKKTNKRRKQLIFVAIVAVVVILTASLVMVGIF